MLVLSKMGSVYEDYLKNLEQVNEEEISFNVTYFSKDSVIDFVRRLNWNSLIKKVGKVLNPAVEIVNEI